MLLSSNESAKIDYFFKKSGASSLPILLPNQPSAVSVVQNTAHEHFYAIDGTPLTRRSQKLHWTISIEGFSGVSKRNFVDQEGVKRLYSISKILESFEISLQRYRKEGKALDFYDLNKGKKYTDAFPVAFQYNQSVDSSRLGYVWQLDLVCYSEALFVGDTRSISFSLSADFFSSIYETIDDFTSLASDLSTTIEGFTDRYNRPVRELFGTVQRASDSVLNVVQSGRGTVQATRNTILKAIDTIFDVGMTVVNIGTEVKDLFTEDIPSFYAENQVKDGITDLQNTLIELGLDETSFAIQVEDSMYELQVLAGLHGAYLYQPSTTRNRGITGGSFLDKDSGFSTLATFNTPDNFVSTNDNTEQSKYRYILSAGDNLYRVAVNVYNDVTQWYRIAELNGWLDANTTASGFPPSAGDTLFLPSDPAQLGVSAIPNLVGEGSTLLTDLALVDGDLSFVGEDLQLVSGESNFVQSITNRIRTFQGESVDNPEYGFPNAIGDDTNETFLALEIVDQLLQDPRVLSVEDVELRREDDTFILDLSVLPFEGEAINIITPVGE